MSTLVEQLTPRERELGAIIRAYNDVAEKLKESHEQLGLEVRHLREELRRKNRQLQRRERLAALGELAAGVAHEIRNPLGGIQLLASLLRKELADRPNALSLVSRIIKGVGILEAIVTDILEFGRPSEPDPKLIRLDTLVQETVELAWGQVESENVCIDVSDDFAGLEIETDGVLLQRMLLNLLINAIEASARKPKNSVKSPRACESVKRHVWLEVRSGVSENLIITVSDDGPGIPLDMMERIFNPFFTTKDSGTGLGLAIVHQIAETLNGSIKVSNKKAGGAVFSLSLPRWQNRQDGLTPEMTGPEVGRLGKEVT